ncbi:hypothetical protein E2C01_028160 [Portunus trituberculatus]|uniref:Uncharacterized protein n=1 Tax=Portunus trituberculatus TaxID=210409 RepID=A0A5B7EN54_PORTR|nr:hypothetical protein [Portunus trituberculatus]
MTKKWRVNSDDRGVEEVKDWQEIKMYRKGNGRLVCCWRTGRKKGEDSSQQESDPVRHTKLTEPTEDESQHPRSLRFAPPTVLAPVQWGSEVVFIGSGDQFPVPDWSLQCSTALLATNSIVIGYCNLSLGPKWSLTTALNDNCPSAAASEHESRGPPSS